MPSFLTILFLHATYQPFGQSAATFLLGIPEVTVDEQSRWICRLFCEVHGGATLSVSVFRGLSGGMTEGHLHLVLLMMGGGGWWMVDGWNRLDRGTLVPFAMLESDNL